MPHTSHRKKVQRAKRAVVEGEDGWARITNTNNLQRKPRPLPAQGALENGHDNTVYTSREVKVPNDKTLAKVEEEYKRIQEKWLETDSYKELRKCLIEEVDETLLREVDHCTVFGTGTFSGLIGGWIERCHVSLYQLAVFSSVVQIIEDATGKKPPAYAQEPLYTSLDIDLLSHLGILPVNTPAGFKAITPQSFLYVPNAELEVTLRTIASNPALAIISGKLDFYWRNEKGQACTSAIRSSVRSLEESIEFDGAEPGNGQHDQHSKPLHELSKEGQRDHDEEGHPQDQIEEGLLVCEQFKEGRTSRRLPSADVKDEPFYDTYVYYRRVQEEVKSDSR